MPYFEHADPSVKRRSGFLMPSFRNSSHARVRIEIPYYFALAPNYDFTFHPQYFSKHGMLWQGDWRHRLANGQYTSRLPPSIRARTTCRASPISDPGWRGSLETKGQFSLSSWWRFGWDVTIESDDSFRRFYKLDPILQTDRVNTVYLQGMSERNYFGAKLYQFGGLLLTDPPYSNSWVRPVIDYNYIVGAPGARRRAELQRACPQHDAQRQHRHDPRVVEANWRRKMIDPIGQVWTPFGNARGDVYSYHGCARPHHAGAHPRRYRAARRCRRRPALLLSVRGPHRASPRT